MYAGSEERLTLNCGEQISLFPVSSIADANCWFQLTFFNIVRGFLMDNYSDYALFLVAR